MEAEDRDEQTVGGKEILHKVIQEHLERKARNHSLQRVLAGFRASGVRD
jgi:hypothetical protein